MSQTETGQNSLSPKEVKTEDHTLPRDSLNQQQQSSSENGVRSNVSEINIKDIKDDKQEKINDEQEVISKDDMEDALLLQELFISGNNRLDSKDDDKKKTSDETVKLPKKKRKIELNQTKDADDEKEAYDSRQFKKIDENIYLGDSTVYSWKNLFDDDIIMCTCSPSKKGDITGDDHCGEFCVNRLLCMECVMGYCRCGSKCTNNRFQKKSWKKVEVKRAGEKGFGVFAKEKITKGSFIIEYVGEVLDEKIYKERQEAYDGERHYYFLSVGTNQIIDASKKGNNARFINHSCDPNSVLQKWTVGHQSRIGVFALRDIEKGEEITFDYAMECYGVSFQKCYCGSKKCRGTITSKEVSLLDAKEKSTQLNSEQAKKLRAHKLESKFKQRTLYTLKILEDSSKIPKEVIDMARNEKAFLIRNIKKTEKKRFRQFLAIERQLNETKQKEEVPEFDELGLTEYERAQQTKMYELMEKGVGIVREREIKSRRCKMVSSSSSLVETKEKQPRVTRAKKKPEKTTEEPKKKRGRPPKRASEDISSDDESESEDEESELSYDEESEDGKTKSKRKVGRPKKNSEEPKRKVGRPRKSETSSGESKEKSKARTEASKSETKRRVGRPKKEESEKSQKRKVEESSSSSSDSEDSDRAARIEARRKVGRPRKTESATITTPKVEEEKRKVGRPKKVAQDKKVDTKIASTNSQSKSSKPIITTPKKPESIPTVKSTTEPKRKVGRPRKEEHETKPKEESVKKESVSTSSSTTSNKSELSSDSKPRRIVHNTKAKEESSSESEEETPKRKVGRPRKDENMKKESKKEETQPKRKVGRPRKDEQTEPKRKVGRPRKVIVSSSESESNESESEDDNPKNDYEVFSKFNVRISKVKAYEGLSSLPNKRKYNSQKPRT